MTASTPNGKIRILIADDQNIMRDSIRLRLAQFEDMEVVGESKDLDDALKSAQALLPDVIIINDYLPPMTSAHAASLFRKLGIPAAILAITVKLEMEVIQHSFRLGVDGFMHKQEIDDIIMEAVRSVHKGERYLSPKARELYGKHRQ